MQLLLINKNPAVSRLITLSVQKMGLSIHEIKDFESYEGMECDIALVDSDLYDERAVTLFKNMGLCSHLVYIGARGSEKPSLMDSMLEKPFLPTDFIEMIGAIKKNLASVEMPSKPMETFEEEEASLDEELVGLEMDDIEETPLEEALLEESEEDSIDLDDEASLDDIFDSFDAEDEDASEEASMDELMTTLGSLEDEEDLDEEDSLEKFLDEPEESIDETSVLDGDEIREVKELLEDTPDDEEPLTFEEENDEEESDEDLDDLSDDFMLDSTEDEEQSVDELMKEIEAMGSVGEEVPEEGFIADELREEEESLEEEMEEDLEREAQEDETKESLEDDPMALLEELEAQVGEEGHDAQSTGLEELEEESIEEAVGMDSLDFLKELENEEDALDEEAEEEMEIPQSALLEDDEEEDESFSEPDIEAIESSEHAKPLASGDFFDLLDEASLKAALGESVEEEIAQDSVEDSMEELGHDEEVAQEDVLAQLKDDIQASVSESLSNVLAKNDIKEALKGMKININITFEEE